MAFTTIKPDFNGTLPGVSASGIALLDDITASFIWEDATIQYGFGGKGILRLDSDFAQLYQAIFGRGNTDKSFAFEKLTHQSFAIIDSVTALDFAATDDPNEVDLVVASTDKPRSRTEGFFGFPGDMDKDGFIGESWSIGVFNSGLKVLTARPEAGGGQYGSWTVLHEIGHSLGLKHTHQEVAGIPALDTVGKFMNNERYSVMSYNGASDGVKFGHAVSMMALDVAGLHALYGAEEYATGGSSYSLMNAKGGKLSLAEGAVDIGRAYYCIWDSGGIDTIDYQSKGKSVLINLNDATLDTSGNSFDLQALFAQIQETNFFDYMSKSLKQGIFDEWHNAGGFFSQVLDTKRGKFTDIDGGFSIANGAEIENAVGGNKADLLIGNEQDNSIQGNKGDDTILGAAGEDLLDGGAGRDWLDGGFGNDQLSGGQGNDIFVFSNGYGIDTIMDFADGDIIDLRALAGFDNMQDLFDNHMADVDGDVVITVGEDQLIIRDVLKSELDVSDFAI